MGNFWERSTRVEDEFFSSGRGKDEGHVRHRFLSHFIGILNVWVVQHTFSKYSAFMFFKKQSSVFRRLLNWFPDEDEVAFSSGRGSRTRVLDEIETF